MPHNTIIQKAIVLILFIVLLGSCSTIKMITGKGNISKEINRIGTFDEHFTGLALYDPGSNEWIYRKNASKYFTPASNTKLLTYYASVVTLGEYLNTLTYEIKDDTLFFSGTGDPTFLHPDFIRHRAFDFLISQDTSLQFVFVPNRLDNKFGSGWAWDDYNYDFQPELSDFPIYGNAITIVKQDTTVKVIPPLFKALIEFTEGETIARVPEYNLFQVGKDADFEDQSIPFITSPNTTISLLADTLKRKVYKKENHEFVNAQNLAGIESSLLYEIMMKRSDNFYAEQLLLMGSRKKGFEWSTDKFRYYILSKYLDDLPQPIIWRDGSGLSRYNLVTPESMVGLLKKIEDEVGFETIKRTFPVGGQSGTIRNWYSAEKPYVYAKTGTLSNNHNLSGFIITGTGRKLIFSFMNNNYIRPSSEIKQSMERLLQFIRDHY